VLSPDGLSSATADGAKTSIDNKTKMLVTLYAPEDRFGPVNCFPQEEFVKIYFFLPTTARPNYLQKMHFVFGRRGRSSSSTTMPRSARRFLS
jgi:hypothetical protein